MKVTVERRDPPELAFVVEDVDQAVMNSLRRVIVGEVPYVAIDKDSVMFFKNTCVLHNHFLAQTALPTCKYGRHSHKQACMHGTMLQHRKLLRTLRDGGDVPWLRTVPLLQAALVWCGVGVRSPR